MDYIAISKNVKIAPRKLRLVVDGIKQPDVARVLILLSRVQKRAAQPVKKTIASAIANAVHNFKVKKEDLMLRNIIIQEGMVYKRFHYAARGRVRPYKKRSSHIRVILADKTSRAKKLPASQPVDSSGKVDLKSKLKPEQRKERT